MHLVLTPGDQHHLYTTSVRALTTAQRRGDMRQVEYWAGRPIISIAVSPYVSFRKRHAQLSYFFQTPLCSITDRETNVRIDRATKWYKSNIDWSHRSFLVQSKKIIDNTGIIIPTKSLVRFD